LAASQPPSTGPGVTSLYAEGGPGRQVKARLKAGEVLIGGIGSSDYARSTDVESWIVEQDAETTRVVHIETRRGYENAEEIVSTPGVDMVYVGPGDSSVELGRPG